MSSSETRTFWISIGVALFAIFLLYSWSQTQKEEVSRKFGATKRVVVASQDIAEMETIDESKLEMVEKPAEFIQPDFISEPEVAVGQVAAAPIKKGEQLLQTKLLLPGPDTGLSMEVSPTKRALSIPIDDMRGVSRLLRPGDRIDLIAAIDYGKGADQKKEVRTVLQDAPVLATGVNVANKIPVRFEKDSNGSINRINLSGNTNFNNITIEVKPEEAQQIIYILATSPGSLFVTLRHPNDRYVNPTRTTAVEDVLGRPNLRLPSAVPAVVAPPPPVVAPRMPLKKRNGRFEEL